MNPALELALCRTLAFAASVLPCGLSMLFFFLGSLRMGRGKAVCAVGAVCLLSAAAYGIMGLGRTGAGGASLAVFFAGSLVYLGLFWGIASGGVEEKVFAYAVSVCYCSQVSMLVHAINGAAPAGMGEVAHCWLYCAATIAVTAASMPLLAAAFIKKISGAVVRAEREIVSKCSIVMGCCAAFALMCTAWVLPGMDAVGRLILAAIASAGVASGCSLMFAVLNYMAERETAESRAALAEAQLDMQRSQYLRLAEQIEQTRKIRHDFRHHVAALNAMAQDGNVVGVRKYLAEYANTLPTALDEKLCNNYIVDVMARHYLTIARREGVVCTVRLALPEHIPMMHMDLCIIMGNCLENALDACRKLPEGKRRIHLAAKVAGNSLVITLDNSFDGTLSGGNKGEFSTKLLGGLGLQNVKAAVERYGGHSYFGVNGEMFQSSVVIPIRGDAVQAGDR